MMKQLFVSLLIANMLVAGWLMWKSFVNKPILEQDITTKLVLLAEQPIDKSLAIENDQIIQKQMVCYIVGPIDTLTKLQSIENTLAEHPEITVAKKQTQVKEALGYRVFIPKQTSLQDSIAIAKRLAEKNVQDYYVITIGDEANTISLGVYGNEDNAKRRKNSMAKLGFSVQIAPHSRTYDAYFLTLRLHDEQLHLLPNAFTHIKTSCT